MQKSVDPELGVPYAVYPIEVNPYDKVFHSTLIEYPFGSSPRAVSPISSPRGIILYVHGYNDYFFQEELAEKSDSAGFAFFAIDLHYNGRPYCGIPRSFGCCAPHARCPCSKTGISQVQHVSLEN